VDYVGQQLGNYRILRLLGTGGFAEVYLGEHIRLNTEAAIKVLHTQLTDKEMEDFLNEARTIARLDHPNIVRVMEFDVQAGNPFLVMTYAVNNTLRQRHPRGQRLSLATIVPYVKQVADALQYAHESELIHRDVKPENMLVGRRNEILLSDFGIATVARTSRSGTGQDMAGTAAYMAPEQIQGHPRYASDQYSLGIVVYEWLTGDRPFHGSFIETCSQHLYAYPPPLRAKMAEAPPEVEQVVLKALEKDSYQRFPSIQAFAAALDQASKSSQTVATALSPHSVHPAAIPTCPDCGKQVPPNATFCGNCGYHFPVILGEAQPTFQASRDGHTPPIASQYGGQTQGQVGNWPHLNTVGATGAAGAAGITPRLYPLPAQKPRGKRTMLIASALLLVALIVAGIVGYPYINMLLHPPPASLACLSSIQNLLLGDCFQDNTNQWDLTGQPGQFSVNISNGSLVLKDNNNTLLPEVVRGNPHMFTDFRLEVDADLSQGDPINGYGVIIRGALDTSGTFKTYYRFELFGNGQYAIYKGVQSGSGTSDMVLVAVTSSNAIYQQGSINHIRITATGGTIALMVNNVAVHSITDSSYNTGYVALFVSNVQSAAPMAQATFSKLGIYQS